MSTFAVLSSVFDAKWSISFFSTDSNFKNSVRTPGRATHIYHSTYVLTMSQKQREQHLELCGIKSRLHNCALPPVIFPIHRANTRAKKCTKKSTVPLLTGENVGVGIDMLYGLGVGYHQEFLLV
jgi:hypothetical protein